MNVTFEFEKDTKNTIRFKEVVGDDDLQVPAIGTLYVPAIGTLYVPKTTLREIGYKQGDKLVVSLSTTR